MATAKTELFPGMTAMKQAVIGMVRSTALLIFSLLALQAAAVAAPQVSIPPAGTHGFPFGSSALDLAHYGYVEEEYFMAGMAQSFINTGVLGNDGKWNAEPVLGGAASYKTRLLVRRPASSRKFNGTVIVEWINVSGGIDATPDWALMHEELLREGYAWVGVSAQFIGAMSLRTWEQGAGARYATILHPGDSFSYDIFSQAGAAIRNPQADGTKPLAGLTHKIKAMIATGHSQSGSRMLTYANAIQPLAQIYNGILIRGPFGASALSQSSAATLLNGTAIPAPAGVPATVNIPAPSLPLVRDDLSEPIILVNSETEVNLPFTSLGVHLQADSAMVRIWEVAGTAHADQESLVSLRADASKSLGPIPERDCGPLATNNGSAHGQAVRAAVDALNRWVRWGIAAANGERIQVNAAVFPPAIVRDPATGLAVGGIRLPDVAVPTATLTGVRPLGIVSNDQNCFLFGAADGWNADTDSYDGLGYDISPTPEPSLLTLYPSHKNYLFKVVHSSLELMFGGFMRPRDVLDTIHSAAAAPVPE